MFIETKRRKERRKSVSRENTRLYSENALTGRKIVFFRAKPSLGKAKTRLPSKRRNRVYLTKTCPGKAETFLQSEEVARKGENETFSLFASIKVEKAFPEQKRRSQKRKTFTEQILRSERRKRVYRANTILAKAKSRLSNENIPRKGGNVSTERRRRTQRRKRLCRS